MAVLSELHGYRGKVSKRQYHTSTHRAPGTVVSLLRHLANRRLIAVEGAFITVTQEGMEALNASNKGHRPQESQA